MNSTIETLINHRSDRSFLDKAIPDGVLDSIIQSAYRAPTSVHSQQVSLVITRDKETKEKLAALAGWRTTLDCSGAGLYYFRSGYV